jgi:general secretion pathway protein E
VPDDTVSVDALGEAIKPWRLNGTARPYKPVGCLDCRMTGFKGRVGLYELLPVTEGIRQAMHPVVDMARIKQVAVKEGLKPLRLAGAMKVAEGLTTLEEVLRNTPQWES